MDYPIELEFIRLNRQKNETLNRWEQYYCQELVGSYPLIINIPTGSRCNIRCRFCTDRSRKGSTGNYRDLAFEEFIARYDTPGWRQAFIRSKTLALYGWGEPLVNPDYARVFDHIASAFPTLGISLCTNGILFSHSWSEKMLAAENSEINFSVNAATKETYRFLTGSGQFGRVVENIGYLCGRREEEGTDNPLVALSFVATTANIEELPQFVDLAADLKADSIMVQDVMLLNDETEQLSLAKHPAIARKFFQLAKERAQERGIPFFSFATHEVGYFAQDRGSQTPRPRSQQYEIDLEKRVPSPYFQNTDCFDPWERFMIGQNGDVFPCCRYESFSTNPLGNVRKQDFQEIWNGRTYLTLRRTINTHVPPPACAQCPRKLGLDYR